MEAQSNENSARRFYLRSVRLNQGGYDSNGRYFGHGLTVYAYTSVSGDEYGWVRGLGREDAKAAVRKLFPNVRFFR